MEEQKQELEQDEFGLGLALGYGRRLRITENNTPVIVAYLKALGNEIHLSDNYNVVSIAILISRQLYQIGDS